LEYHAHRKQAHRPTTVLDAGQDAFPPLALLLVHKPVCVVLRPPFGVLNFAT
jgi:hypothetical protein